MNKYLLIFLLFMSCDQFNNPVIVIGDPYSYNDTCLIGLWAKYPPYTVFTTGNGWVTEFKRGGSFLEICYKNDTIENSFTKTGIWKTTKDNKFRINFDSNRYPDQEGIYDILYTNQLYLKYSWINGNTEYQQHNIMKKKGFKSCLKL